MSSPLESAQTKASTSLEHPEAVTTTEAATLASSTKTSAPAPTTSSSAATTTTAETAAAAEPHDAPGRQPATASAAAAELSRTQISLLGALRRFPDFPIPGINFIDILPLFQDPAIHNTLLRALELQVLHFGLDDPQAVASSAAAAAVVKPDVVVGLDARGFLFGPSLALRLNASFVPVRKKGKMPGPCVTAAFEKEYGTDFFQMQQDAIKPGQKVLVVDDIIATGGSAAAAGSLVKQLGGDLIGYLFILEIPFLKGREKLGGLPTYTLLETDD